MQLSYLIISNYVALVVLITLALAVHMNGLLATGTKKCFRILLVAQLVELLAYNGELYYASLPVPSAARTLLSAIGYTIRPMEIMLILQILAAKRIRKATKKLCVLALGIDTLLAFSAFFSPIAYTYTENNGFSRGPLGLVFYYVPILLILMVLVFAIRDAKNEHAELPMVIVSSAVVLFGMVIEYFSGVSGISKPAFALATLCIYLHFEVNESDAYAKLMRRRVREDGMTGILNRTAFIEDMELLESRKAHNIAVIYADINGLKAANDLLGHAVGDTLLLRAVTLLKKYGRDDRDRVYRVGGDEFVVLCREIDRNLFEQHLASLREELRKDRILSCGGAWFESIDSVNNAIRIAERSMYADKADYYAEHPELDRRKG